ncbi:MAG: helix-turn-helix transcriptional regulator [Oscillospiraceae bacterium]|nr:helix-turn-helix transcriptional regulator [Oscillospiraceae bacterium]
MQVNLGEKIRVLRKRDSRTQEALADALGVTSQAVSRWEANGGYPDMEIIPSIANYFHITIDELFGYDNDRDSKMKLIMCKADDYLNAQGDMMPCVALLREAISEFPSEPQLLVRLGYALTQLGWQKYGARGKTVDGSDYTQNDIEYNSQNEYWQEALSLFERVLVLNIDSEDRMAVITVAIRLYASMGATDKAEAMALRQDSVTICREILLSAAAEGEKRDLYQGEALIALIRQLKNVMETAVMSKLSMCWSESGIQKLLDVAHLYESILDDGNCGICHADLRELYLWSAIFTARQGNTERAMEYFNIGFTHEKKYEAIRNTGLYHYTAPLVSKVTFPSDNFPTVPGGSWKGWLSAAPEDLIEAIKADDRYSECFV